MSRRTDASSRRYGNVQGADWQRHGRSKQASDDRVPTPLPDGVPCFLVAATTAERATAQHGNVVGDGLVPLASALGHHADPALALDVPKEHRLVVIEANHLDLLNSAEVSAKLKVWLAPTR